MNVTSQGNSTLIRWGIFLVGPGHCLDGSGKYLPKENDLPLSFAPTNICPLGCLDGVVNVDVDERGRARPTTNLLQFATF
jgi:hypothetical protein